jgi:peptide-methionine (R)-S-oxide reductase
MQVNRRALIAGLAGVAGSYGLFWTIRRALMGAPVRASETNPGPVAIVQFRDNGERIAAATLPKVVKSDSDWLKVLSEEQFEVTRRAATEPPFHNAYFQNHQHGLYRCICCGNALFSSETKFESGTGWPSFWQPIAPENVYVTKDSSLFLERDAVSCRLCDAHLGHVFDDGPKPTGLRYCMNSASLRFVSSKLTS